MPRLIIGLVGLQGSGKGTAAKILQESYGAKLYRFSSVLSDMLDRLAVERSRDNLIKLSEAVRHAYGEDVLAYAIERDAATSDADIVVVDGIRRIEDLAALEPNPKFKLISVEAPADLRFERMKGRGEKSGERDMTREVFEAQERAPTEITIPSVAARASFHIDNSGTQADLETKIRALMQQLL